jgi:hypothetical protein
MDALQFQVKKLINFMHSMKPLFTYNVRENYGIYNIILVFPNSNYKIDNI